MPPKRTRVPELDPESDGEPSKAQKRVRTSEEGDEEPQQTQLEPDLELEEPPVAPVEINDSDLEDNEEFVEPEPPNEVDEKRFEEEHEAQIRERVAAVKSQGNIAEMGIIEKLELTQFMCHKYLEFNFGPQINFIIGHNGSGKSAVLSALTVALGGKANVTGRGSGIKSFIREGQNAAEVSVTLKNQGEDAYKHKEYGDSIIITRRFTREGSSSYKIKSKSGKTISTKREELSAICDHMNIQVDNPMNILTQDSARQFLSASAPADKYKFFLRGTQLSQLSDEYSTCLENISQTQRVLKTKTEALPDLHQAYNEAFARYEEAKKARETQQKLHELTGELAWAHVAGKEKELRAKLEEVAKLEKRLPKLRERVQDAEHDLRAAEEVVAQREEEHGQLGDMEHLSQQLRKIRDRIREHRQQLHEKKGEVKQMNSNLQGLNAQIKGYQDKIAAEEQKQADGGAGKREEKERQLRAVIDELTAAEQKLKELQAELQQVNETGSRTQQEQDAAVRMGEQLKANITGAQDQLARIAQREKSKLAPFGANMEQVLQEIEHTQWRGQPPVGPLGRFVKVRDAQKWANIMRTTIGNLMSAFAVTDPQDRRTLETILKQQGNHKPNIIISPVDLFDYSNGEPPEDYLTVLRALDVSDPYVLRVLINSSNIERTLLAPSRADGDRMLMRLGGGGVAWTADLYSVQRFPEGGGRSNLLPPLNRHGGDPRLQLFTNDDLGAQKQRWQEQLREAEQQYKAKGQEVQEFKKTIADCKERNRQLQNEMNQLNRSMRQMTLRRDQLRDELDQSMPVEIQALQLALNEVEGEKELLKKQFEELEQNVARLNAAQHPLLEEEARIKSQMNEFSDRQTATMLKVEDAVSDRMKAQHAKQHFEKKLAEEEAIVAEAKEQAEVLGTEFKNWSGQAAQIRETKFENPRPAEEVKRSIESTKRALQAQQKKNPIPIGDLAKQVVTKRTALETAKNELKRMVSLNKSLRKSVKTRLTRWHEFRRHIALRCKIYFSYHLSRRGYFGKVLFDHVQGLLQLKVQTDDLAGTQGTTGEKDPRSLSGGEKSFSTICLLLSLWESIGCPIRCLDEFDVFMDAVNRRISMKMMIDTANASDRKQYILITPQDMNNVHITPTVRVHRMTDPERGQGVLRFSGST